MGSCVHPECDPTTLNSGSSPCVTHHCGDLCGVDQASSSMPRLDGTMVLVIMWALVCILAEHNTMAPIGAKTGEPNIHPKISGLSFSGHVQQQGPPICSNNHLEARTITKTAKEHCSQEGRQCRGRAGGRRCRRRRCPRGGGRGSS